MRRLFILLVLSAFAANAQLHYNVDSQLEPFFLEAMNDFKEIGFDIPKKEGVMLVFYRERGATESSKAVAKTRYSEKFIVIGVYKPTWEQLTYGQKRAVIAHELLHSFGYDHSNDPRSLMYPNVNNIESMYDYRNAFKYAIKQINDGQEQQQH